ncbi:MAG: DEAD/DEAH box helicase [Flavobacteriales bacterium]|nr:DEAD/DEAH box helicase [Flavobacteriales bacterium]NQX99436.1 DEAD/DEAH box helicase [Flavobacteriales bacterium]
MKTFKEFKLKKQLNFAIDDMGFKNPTPIQSAAFNVVLSGKDVVGIAQTGTGKTFAYMLPILEEMQFSKQMNPRVLVLVPTRELVLQVVDNINSYAEYLSIRVVGVYGGANINMQKAAIMQGCDIIVATPGRLYDLALHRTLKLKGIKKLVIDEVDVMLDLGFRVQLTNIFELLPDRRQNIMFSATMTDEIDVLIDGFFYNPEKIAIALSGTPLDNITQTCYQVKNFYTKVNLLGHLLQDKDKFYKVLVFVANKKSADRLFAVLEEEFDTEMGVIHSNKSQNYRIRSIEQFDNGKNRVLVSTDVMARGLDLDKISHVINFDTPNFPENYMHRIGRTGRAEEKGKTILFFTKEEREYKAGIEKLMNLKIKQIPFPSEVDHSDELTPEERPEDGETKNYNRNTRDTERGASFHEKSEKNSKVNLGGSYKRIIKTKFKKPKTRGDKNVNRGRKKGGK